MPGFIGSRFLARLAESRMSKSSRKKSDEAGDEAIAPQQQFQANSSSSTTNVSKAPYRGSVVVPIPQENFGFKLIPRILRKESPRVVGKECDICTETLPPSSFIGTNGCTHEYCSNCCKRHAEVRIMGGSTQIECPHPDCRLIYDIDQCRLLLSASNFDILNTRLAEAAIPASRKVYCPFADCSAIMEKPESSSGDSGMLSTVIHYLLHFFPGFCRLFGLDGEIGMQQFAICYACDRGFCLECIAPWHANKTCAEYRAEEMNTKLLGDRKLLNLAKFEKWQQCKKCHRMIELIEGCRHITCLCGNMFCYRCGKNWEKRFPTCKCRLLDHY